ncbi:MAG: hypothetical protein QXW72_07380 [Conexivisphaerales archaeon]
MLGKKLELCSDETYPRVKGAVKKLMEEDMVNPKLKRHGGNIVDLKGNIHFPDPFTLALSLPSRGLGILRHPCDKDLI